MKSNGDGTHLTDFDPKQLENIQLPLDSDVPSLSKLRLSQSFNENVGLKKILTTVPVRKPDRQAFIRVHSDESYRLDTVVLELRENKENYLLDQSLWPDLAGEIVAKRLYTAITRQGDLFLWAIRLPGEDGRIDDWNNSAAQAAHRAMSKWVRITSNRSLGAYDVYEAEGDFPDPDWPEIEFEILLKIAFKGRYIQSLDHSIIQRLRGQM